MSLIVFAVHMLAQILGLLVNKFMCVRDVHEEYKVTKPKVIKYTSHLKGSIIQGWYRVYLTVTP